MSAPNPFAIERTPGDVRAGTRPVSEIQAERIEWLWPDRVPFGMGTTLAGAPGTGKTTLLYDLAARSSREGRNTLICTAEDHLAAVVRPRLEAAGGDLGRIHVLTEPLTLPDDIDRLGQHVERLGVDLLVVDPIVAFISDTTNTHRDHHVRRVLAPLSAIAERQHLAACVVLHTNKAPGADPLLRISGSVGFTGAARSVLLAAEDPQDETRRILAVVKSNLAAYPPPLAYSIAGVELPGDIPTSRVQWLGEAPEVDVRELLVSRDPEERSATEDAMEFLRELGLGETARPASDVMREAKVHGYAERTIRRARNLLKIPTWKEGVRGGWYWGPRPNEVSEGATPKGPTSPIEPLAPWPLGALPAETNGAGSQGTHSEGVGDHQTTFEVLSSSESEEWYTPPVIAEAVLAALGEIDLDPCTNPGEPTIPARHHYRKADDGLAHQWGGRVYLNPPYGRSIPKWVGKLVDEFRWGHVSEAIALVPSRPDTRWFALLDAFPRCEISGRLTFANATNPAPFPSAVFYLGPNHDRFLEVFRRLGRIVQPVDGARDCVRCDRYGAEHAGAHVAQWPGS